MENLETTYLGLKLRNPLIAGSCGLTNSITNIKELAKKGVIISIAKFQCSKNDLNRPTIHCHQTQCRFSRNQKIGRHLSAKTQ